MTALSTAITYLPSSSFLWSVPAPKHLVPKLCLGTQAWETPFLQRATLDRFFSIFRNRVSCDCVPKQSLGTRNEGLMGSFPFVFVLVEGAVRVEVITLGHGVRLRHGDAIEKSGTVLDHEIARDDRAVVRQDRLF